MQCVLRSPTVPDCACLGTASMTEAAKGAARNMHGNESAATEWSTDAATVNPAADKAAHTEAPLLKSSAAQDMAVVCASCMPIPSALAAMDGDEDDEDGPSTQDSSNTAVSPHVKRLQSLEGADEPSTSCKKQETSDGVDPMLPSQEPTLEVHTRLCVGCYGLVALGHFGDKEVVVKMMGPFDHEAIDVWEDECRMYACLQHVQGVLVPRLVAAGQFPSGVHFIATERVFGKTVWELQQEGASPEYMEVVYKAAKQTLKQLQDVVPGFLHGDIRAPNIIIPDSTDGRISAVFLDFGFSCTDGQVLEQVHEFRALRNVFSIQSSVEVGHNQARA